MDSLHSKGTSIYLHWSKPINTIINFLDTVIRWDHVPSQRSLTSSSPSPESLLPSHSCSSSIVVLDLHTKAGIGASVLLVKVPSPVETQWHAVQEGRGWECVHHLQSKPFKLTPSSAPSEQSDSPPQSCAGIGKTLKKSISSLTGKIIWNTLHTLTNIIESYSSRQ